MRTNCVTHWTLRVAVVTIAGSLLIPISACSKQRSTEQSSSSEAEATRAPGALLPEGAKVPELAFKAHTGQNVRLSNLRGKPIVVYFYPKDDTPGCTVEAQEIRDLWMDIQKTGAVVIGVSSDSEASHRDFATKYELPFLLAPDEDHKIANAFGVPITMGKAKRVTFVVGPDGRIRKVFPDVTPKGHGAEVIDALRGIGSG